MKLSVIIAVTLLLFPCSGHCQIQVLTGTTFTIQTGTTLSTSTGININAGGTLNNAGTLDLKQDLVNDGTLSFSPGIGIASFSGTSAQQISGTGTISVPVLQLNNASGLSLQTPVTITGQLQLISGNLAASSASPLHFNTIAANPVETSGNRIIGTAIMDSRPVGTAALSKFLDVQLTAGADLGNIQIVRTTGTSGMIVSGGKTSIDANWLINTTTPPALPDRAMTLTWLSDDDNAKNMNAVDLWAAPPPYTSYSRLNASSQNVSGSNPRVFTQSNLSQFDKRFTISDFVSPLPLTLLSFSAVQGGDNVTVAWETANATSVKRMVLQRGTDGITYGDIAVFPADTKMNREYQYEDREIMQAHVALAYYRLQMQDRSGTNTYSEVRSVALAGKDGIISKIFPNPFEDIVRFYVTGSGFINIRLTDATGKMVYRAVQEVQDREEVSIKGLAGLNPGTYFLEVIAGSRAVTYTLQKAH